MNYWVNWGPLCESHLVISLFHVGKHSSTTVLSTSLLIIFILWWDELFFIYSLKKKQQNPPQTTVHWQAALNISYETNICDNTRVGGNVICRYYDANNRFKFCLSQDPMGALLWVKKIEKGQAPLSWPQRVNNYFKRHGVLTFNKRASAHKQSSSIQVFRSP